MTRRQNGKDKKRKKGFHRKGEAWRWLRQSKKIDTGKRVDYTEAKPKPLKRKGSHNRGDALS